MMLLTHNSLLTMFALWQGELLCIKIKLGTKMSYWRDNKGSDDVVQMALAFTMPILKMSCPDTGRDYQTVHSVSPMFYNSTVSVTLFMTIYHHRQQNLESSLKTSCCDWPAVRLLCLFLTSSDELDADGDWEGSELWVFLNENQLDPGGLNRI